MSYNRSAYESPEIFMLNGFYMLFSPKMLPDAWRSWIYRQQ